jgi:hypothetical protein
VQESGLAEQAGIQQSELGTAQQGQELGAKAGEQQMRMSAQSFIDNAQLDAQKTATFLEQAGVDSVKNQQFSAEEAKKARDFQQNVLLPMQNSQFKTQLAAQVKQFTEQMKLQNKFYDLEKDAQDFNKRMAEIDANKQGMFDSIMSSPQKAWKSFEKGNFLQAYIDYQTLGMAGDTGIDGEDPIRRALGV